jgi:RNA polymerase sigma factor (sigma-70 family)
MADGRRRIPAGDPGAVGPPLRETVSMDGAGMSASTSGMATAKRASDPSEALKVLLEDGSLAGLSDGQLLTRFLDAPQPVSEMAFALLVERQGPMVLRVCRDLLRDPHDAEDAFQAVFLVLARRAAAIRKEDAVGCWLYGVARRISLRLRRQIARRRTLERGRRAFAVPAEAAPAPPSDPWPELYEEIDRLPSSFRAAVVLCDLQGNSYEQAARLLHCPLGTLQSRLARGRRRLRQRLERRKLGPAPALLASRPSLPPVSQELVARTVEAAQGFATASLAPAGAVVPALAAAELRHAAMARALAIAAVGLVAASAMVGAALVPGGRPEEPRGAALSPPPQARNEPVVVRVVDPQGRPVPGIAVETTGFDLDETRVLRTDADGFLGVPATALGGGLTLLARNRDDSLGWVEFQDADPKGAAGTRADPVLMRLRPLAHRVRGTVLDRQGKGIAGAEVVAQGLGVRAGGMQEGQMFVLRPEQLPSLPRARTDQEGRFEIVLPDRVGAHLVAWHPRFISNGMHAEPDALTAAAITLEPAGTIAGRVVDAATGQPVLGTRLSAQLIDYHRVFRGGGWGEARADDQGRFAINGLEPGVYNLLFEKAPGRPGAAARGVEGLRVRAGQSTAALVKVIEGRPLRGLVLDQQTRQPVPGVMVGCYGPARPQSGAQVMARKTDATGAFTFFVPPGEQHVYLMEGNIGSRLGRASPDVPEQGPVAEVRLIKAVQPAANQMQYMMKAAVRAAEPAPPAEKAAPVEAAGKEAMPEKAADRPAIRTVRGRVRDAKGQPVPAARVSLDIEMQALVPDAQPGSSEIVATDRDGVFELDGMPRVALKVWVKRPGFYSQPAEVSADRDDVVVLYRFEPEPGAKQRPVIHRDDPIPAEIRGRLTFADLSTHANEPLADGPGGAGNDLNRLPRGTLDLGGQFFRVGDDMIHLAGQMTGGLPGEAKGIELKAKAHRLHFLHAVQQGLPPATEVGAYVVRYVDGSSERIPIVYGRDLVNWWTWKKGVPEVPSGARIAWTGENDDSERNKSFVIRLYSLTWTNPHPDREIAALDFESAVSLCDPFLVAVTLERAR